MITAPWLQPLVAVLTERPVLGRLAFTSVEFAALALAAGAILKFVRPRQPRLAALLWLVVMAKPLAGLIVGAPLPLLGLTLPAPPPPAPVIAMAPAIEPMPVLDAAPLEFAAAPAAPVAAPPIDWAALAPRLILWAWLAGAGLLALRLAASAVRLALLIRRAAPPPAWIADRLNDLGREGGARRLPRCLVTDRLESPALAGFWRPVILLPAWLCAEGEPAHVEWSLRHELMHWRLRDPLASLVCELVKILFFFHPAAWWAGRRWQEATELACDRALIQSAEEAEVYVQELYRMLLKVRDRRRLPLTGGLFAGRTQISRRIESLLRDPLRSPARLSAATVAFVVAFSLATLAVGVGIKKEKAAEQATTTPAPAPDEKLPAADGDQSSTHTLASYIEKSVADSVELNPQGVSTLKGNVRIELKVGYNRFVILADRAEYSVLENQKRILRLHREAPEVMLEKLAAVARAEYKETDYPEKRWITCDRLRIECQFEPKSRTFTSERAIFEGDVAFVEAGHSAGLYAGSLVNHRNLTKGALAALFAKSPLMLVNTSQVSFRLGGREWSAPQFSLCLDDPDFAAQIKKAYSEIRPPLRPMPTPAESLNAEKAKVSQNDREAARDLLSRAAQATRDKKSPEEALNLIHEALRKDPTSASGWVALAEEIFHLKTIGLNSSEITRIKMNDPEIWNAYAKALSYDPANVAALLGLADICGKSHHPAEAAKYYELALQADPRNIGAFGSWIHLDIESNDLTLARKHLERLKAARPDDFLVRTVVKDVERAEAKSRGEELPSVVFDDLMSLATWDEKQKPEAAVLDPGFRFSAYGSTLTRDPRTGAYILEGGAHVSRTDRSGTQSSDKADTIRIERDADGKSIKVVLNPPPAAADQSAPRAGAGLDEKTASPPFYSIAADSVMADPSGFQDYWGHVRAMLLPGPQGVIVAGDRMRLTRQGGGAEVAIERQSRDATREKLMEMAKQGEMATGGDTMYVSADRIVYDGERREYRFEGHVTAVGRSPSSKEPVRLLMDDRDRIWLTSNYSGELTLGVSAPSSDRDLPTVRKSSLVGSKSGLEAVDTWMRQAKLTVVGNGLTLASDGANRMPARIEIGTPATREELKRLALQNPVKADGNWLTANKITIETFPRKIHLEGNVAIFLAQGDQGELWTLDEAEIDLKPDSGTLQVKCLKPNPLPSSGREKVDLRSGAANSPAKPAEEKLKTLDDPDLLAGKFPIDRMTANTIEIDPKGTSRLSGKVKIESKEYNLFADQLDLDNKTKILHATGEAVKLDVHPDDPKNLVQAQGRRLTHDLNQGSFVLEGATALTPTHKVTADIIRIQLNKDTGPQGEPPIVMKWEMRPGSTAAPRVEERVVTPPPPKPPEEKETFEDYKIAPLDPARPEAGWRLTDRLGRTEGTAKTITADPKKKTFMLSGDAKLIQDNNGLKIQATADAIKVEIPKDGEPPKCSFIMNDKTHPPEIKVLDSETTATRPGERQPGPGVNKMNCEDFTIAPLDPARPDAGYRLTDRQGKVRGQAQKITADTAAKVITMTGGARLTPEAVHDMAADEIKLDFATQTFTATGHTVLTQSQNGHQTQVTCDVARLEFNTPDGNPKVTCISKDGKLRPIEAEIKAPTPVKKQPARPTSGTLQRLELPSDDKTITGLVVDGKGKPVHNAKVALGDFGGQRQAIIIENGEISGAETSQTDAQGKFTLHPVTRQFTLAAVADQGIGFATGVEGQAAIKITLWSWGQVEGEYRIGDRPGSYEFIHLMHNSVKLPNTLSPVFFHYQTETDKKGHFKWSKVPPGINAVGDYINFPFKGNATNKTGGSLESLIHPTLTLVPPGETVHLTIGGSGRPLTGKIALPLGLTRPVGWRYNVVIYFHPKTLSNLGGSFERYARQAWNKQWLPEQMTAQTKGAMPYTCGVEPDGSFTIKDIPYGNYTMVITAFEPDGMPRDNPVAKLNQPVTVQKEQGGQARAPQSLGVLTLNKYEKP